MPSVDVTNVLHEAKKQRVTALGGWNCRCGQKNKGIPWKPPPLPERGWRRTEGRGLRADSSGL
jgi:hypothetical protein